VIAAIDDYNKPTTRVIDIMLSDDKGLYFLTAKGKSFYDQLMSGKYICLSGITGGNEPMDRKSISISGYVENTGYEMLEEIFESNLYMKILLKIAKQLWRCLEYIRVMVNVLIYQQSQ